MPLRYISVEKETPFQGRTESWSNVYCYNMTDVSLAAHQALEDAVLAAERLVHSTVVTFRRTRTFTTEGLNTGDEGTMFNITERNALGTASGANLGYKECAVLVKWPLPRKVKFGGGLGRQRSLKKWIHSCGFGTFSNTETSGESPITSGNKTIYTTYAASVRTPNGNSALVTASDSSEPSASAIVHPYLEHRQFPRGRKEGLL